MTKDARKEALEQAIADWKHKHAITDDDPILATVELWKAFLRNGPDAESAELRASLEQFAQISAPLIKQCNELIRELRMVPKLRNELWAFPYFAVVFVAVLAFITGMLVGRFLL